MSKNPKPKFVIVIPDGAADSPIEDLGNKTPLEVAHKPFMDEVALNGRIGTVRTTPEKFMPGSDVCTLSLLGYDPAQYHPGRAPLEAAAMGLKLSPDQWVFRCNFVTIVDGRMIDHSAGHLKDAEARELIQALNTQVLNSDRFAGINLHPGVSYRNLMTIRGVDFGRLKTTPPHDIPDQPVAPHFPRGPENAILLELMTEARRVLAAHDVNAVRAQFGEKPATDIWLWGQGKAASLPSFEQRFGIYGAMLTSVDLLRGIANLLGWRNIDVPGMTSYHDNDYAAQGRYTVEAIDEFDIVCTHIEAPDEASHQSDYVTKVAAIEAIDRHIVGPVLQKLKTFERWRILIMPDHATECLTRKHHDAWVPFAMAGAQRKGALPRPYTEAAARDSDLHVGHGHELMDYFLSGLAGTHLVR